VGAAASAELPGSVIPFILRATSILGIDSVMAPFDTRMAAWDRVRDLYSAAAYESLITEARLDDVPEHAARMLKGGVAGRVIINPRDAAT
jgi:acrylyl-CoA reductase (NADPH)